MKQLISVRAIIRDDERILLIKRASGRKSILGKYELPGGKLSYGEQPEDALRRYAKDEIGLIMQSARLFDVLTYIDHDDRDIQYTFILYTVSVDTSGQRLSLSQNYSDFIWEKPVDVDQQKLTESSKLLLGISQQNIQKSIKGTEVIHAESVLDPELGSHAIIYSDGGSRGNPGPSASGFIIMNHREEVVHQGGMYIGVTTNDQAEYHGVRLGLEKALEAGVKIVDFRMDSLMGGNQLTGAYKIKNSELWPIHEHIKELIKKFEKVTFSHVRREFNQLADGMVNKILNAHEEQNEV